MDFAGCIQYDRQAATSPLGNDLRDHSVLYLMSNQRPRVCHEFGSAPLAFTPQMTPT